MGSGHQACSSANQQRHGRVGEGQARSRLPAGPLRSSQRAGLVRQSVLYSQWLFQKNRSSTRPLVITISSTKGGSASPGSCGRNRQLLCVSCCFCRERHLPSIPTTWEHRVVGKPRPHFCNSLQPRHKRVAGVMAPTCLHTPHLGPLFRHETPLLCLPVASQNPSWWSQRSKFAPSGTPGPRKT